MCGKVVRVKFVVNYGVCVDPAHGKNGDLSNEDVFFLLERLARNGKMCTIFGSPPFETWVVANDQNSPDSRNLTEPLRHPSHLWGRFFAFAKAVSSNGVRKPTYASHAFLLPSGSAISDPMHNGESSPPGGSGRCSVLLEFGRSQEALQTKWRGSGRC